jgi:hypothetical protein
MCFFKVVFDKNFRPQGYGKKLLSARFILNSFLAFLRRINT